MTTMSPIRGGILHLPTFSRGPLLAVAGAWLGDPHRLYARATVDGDRRAGRDAGNESANNPPVRLDACRARLSGAGSSAQVPARDAGRRSRPLGGELDGARQNRPGVSGRAARSEHVHGERCRYCTARTSSTSTGRGAPGRERAKSRRGSGVVRVCRQVARRWAEVLLAHLPDQELRDTIDIYAEPTDAEDALGGRREVDRRASRDTREGDRHSRPGPHRGSAVRGGARALQILGGARRCGRCGEQVWLLAGAGARAVGADGARVRRADVRAPGLQS